MIKIENLTKIYNKGKTGEVTALQGISCELNSSGMVFIVGRSGCGKSTLLNILGQLDGEDGGTVSIDGKPINNFTEDERADYRNHFVGFVFQEYNLIENYTVKENVEIALDLQGETEKDNKIAEALKLVELEGSEDRKVNELSGGQKQRVAIARAVVKNPKLLLCDEPTGSLDSKTGTLIFALLKKLSKQNLVVVVSHDEEAAKKYADRIIELKDGEIVGDSNFCDFSQKQNIENEKDERAKNKDKLPFSSKVKLGLDFLFGKPTRIIIALILCVVSFVLLSLSSSFSMIDKNAMLTNSLYENGIAWLSYKKTGYSKEEGALYPLKMNDKDISFLQKELGTNSVALVYDLYTSVNFYFATDSAYININYYDDVANGFTEISQEFLNDYGFTLKGSLPQADDEVIITQYLFDMYKAYGYQNGSVKEKIENYDDIFNKKITSTETGLPQLEMRIVGVVDTKFNTERYDVLLEKNPPENTSVLVNEIRTMMRQGLHNVLYFREDYYARNIAGRYDTQLVKGEGSFEVVRGDREYSYSGIRRADTLPKGKIYYHTDYNQANAQADFGQGKKSILLPSSSINTANVNNLISAFAMEHYYELDEEAKKIYSTWYSYASYIKNSGNAENEYHPGKNYEYFFNENLKQIFAQIPVNIELTHRYVPEYATEVTFIGFYDNAIIGIDENILLVSNEVFEEFTWGLGENLYDVAYATTPVTQNYKIDLAHVELAEKHIDEQVRVPGYNSYMTDYIFYNIENEATYSYINAKGLLDIFQTVFSWVSLGLGLLAVVFIYYHISGVIADKQKDIGILYALGMTKKDVLLMFLLGNAVFAIGIILISSIISGILTIIGNDILMKQLYLLLPLFNFSVGQVLIVAVTTVVAVLIGVLFPLMRLTKKQPMELIRKL